MKITRRTALASAAFGLRGLSGQSDAAAQPWISLFDGHSLAGWKEVAFPGRGTVAVKDSVIHLGKGHMTGIALAAGAIDFPREAYEIRFEAARLAGNDFFAGLTFPVKDTHCSWINGGWDGTVVGLSNVDGYDASENETSTNRDFTLGRWYGFRLAVTANRVRAWIDAAEVIDVDTRHHKLSLRFDDIDLCKPLGFASYATVAGLRKIEYRRLPSV